MRTNSGNRYIDISPDCKFRNRGAPRSFSLSLSLRSPLWIPRHRHRAPDRRRAPLRSSLRPAPPRRSPHFSPDSEGPPFLLALSFWSRIGMEEDLCISGRIARMIRPSRPDRLHRLTPPALSKPRQASRARSDAPTIPSLRYRLHTNDSSSNSFSRSPPPSPEMTLHGSTRVRCLQRRRSTRTDEDGHVENKSVVPTPVSCSTRPFSRSGLVDVRAQSSVLFPSFVLHLKAWLVTDVANAPISFRSRSAQPVNPRQSRIPSATGLSSTLASPSRMLSAVEGGSKRNGRILGSLNSIASSFVVVQ